MTITLAFFSHLTPTMLKEHVRRLTSKGQVTVPVDVRRKLGVQPGETVIFRILDDRVEIDRAPMSLEQAFGSVRPLKQPEDFEAAGQQAWDEHAGRVLREMQEE
ncbi:MAG: AbrB/MazE/SpoVT family DNA-binding domain-containing protein [Chloroflexi bacterium]|nr:AbrB/MazE/SpoVT family DNA-binding domain-containing protein [Chloroflexota bacterium]